MEASAKKLQCSIDCQRKVTFPGSANNSARRCAPRFAKATNNVAFANSESIPGPYKRFRSIERVDTFALRVVPN